MLTFEVTREELGSIVGGLSCAIALSEQNGHTEQAEKIRELWRKMYAILHP